MLDVGNVLVIRSNVQKHAVMAYVAFVAPGVGRASGLEVAGGAACVLRQAARDAVGGVLGDFKHSWDRAGGPVGTDCAPGGTFDRVGVPPGH